MDTQKQLTDLKITVNGISVSVPAPYCTPAEWAQRIGMTESEVKKQLQVGRIARHQAVAYGHVFVNVVQEIRKTIEAKPY